MRFKFSLLVLPDKSGVTLPITYQQNLSLMFKQELMGDAMRYDSWLSANHIPTEIKTVQHYVISNLYIPKILVEDDRLKICVPRVQFWVSFLPEIETRALLEERFLNKEICLGDDVSSVHFQITEIEDISPVNFKPVMEYQTLSPIVVKAYRSNHTLEYLSPTNPYFSQFLMESLIERWEHYYGCKFYDSPNYRFRLLSPERRKAVPIQHGVETQKYVGYMMKFRLEMSPILHEFAYVTGLGDDITEGFGYVELIRKHK